MVLNRFCTILYLLAGPGASVCTGVRVEGGQGVWQACVWERGTVCGGSRCMVPPHAYLICIGRTGTGTDLVHGAYRSAFRRCLVY
eukprot:COSAG01_NODE_12357_length_1753_cov_2.945586_1_plen_84_part_10